MEFYNISFLCKMNITYYFNMCFSIKIISNSKLILDF